MASTFQPIQAIDYVKKFVKNMPIEQVQTQILDDTSKYLWMAKSWRWTIGNFPAITMVASTQDYTTVALPSDFLYIYSGYLYTPDTTTGAGLVRPIEIVSWLNPGGVQGQPHSAAVVLGSPGGNGTVRFFPQPTAVPTGQTFNSVYKKQSPVIGPKDLYTAGIQAFDDEWFWVYESGCLYHAYLYADDQRAGSAQIGSNGQVQFTGQRGVFEANIQIMAEREKMRLVSPPTEDRKGN